ncbi:MAG: 16S rRNA (cytosine(967)-C(5))-methyltransferase, partial [Lachnospiraceae bacterium]|nr:16S rRNA (cytosine(967)-C(5))-methyltransferase [Candidatus Darwinimomas equi]
MINEEGRHSNTVINDALEKYSDASPRDKALFVRLVHGTLEYQIRIDYVIDLFSKVRTSAMRPLIRNLLRLSVYQMMFTDKIPDSAICDEAVKIVKKTSLRNLSGFVNGVLRNIARNRKDITVNDKNIMYSVPE